MNRKSDSSSVLPLIVADIFELAGLFRAQGEKIASTVGQTQARWQVMSAASGAPSTVPQIARRLGVSRQNVQRIADLLVSEEWAEFMMNPDHRTSPYLVLNDRGRRGLARISEAAASSHANLAGRLPARDISAIHSGLRQLIGALNALEEQHEESKQ